MLRILTGFRTGAGAQELGAVGTWWERLRLPLARNPGFPTDEKGGESRPLQLLIQKLKPAKAGQGHVSPACLRSAGRRGPQTQTISQELFPDSEGLAS